MVQSLSDLLKEDAEGKSMDQIVTEAMEENEKQREERLKRIELTLEALELLTKEKGK